VLLGGYLDVLGPEAEVLDQLQLDAGPPNQSAWDAWGDVPPGEAEGAHRAHPQQVADAEKLAAQVLVALAQDDLQSADRAAALPEAELYRRDVVPFAAQSFSDQAFGDARGRLVVQHVPPDLPGLCSQPERGLMERSQLEAQLHAVLMLVERQAAIRL
jgi:hypothetical protein